MVVIVTTKTVGSLISTHGTMILPFERWGACPDREVCIRNLDSLDHGIVLSAAEKPNLGTRPLYAVVNGAAEVTTARSLTVNEHEIWIDLGQLGHGRVDGYPLYHRRGPNGITLFAEMTITPSKSLSIVAALHPDVSEVVDAALGEARRWLSQHTVTRAGLLEAQKVVPVEHIQAVGITYKSSRAGDLHRHIHMQIGTRVWAAGKRGGLGTAAFRASGTARSLH